MGKLGNLKETTNPKENPLPNLGESFGSLEDMHRLYKLIICTDERREGKKTLKELKELKLIAIDNN